MIVNTAFVIFFAFALLFFVTTIFTKSRYLVIILNIVFLLITYVSISDLLGEAKPVAPYPLYQHAQWDSDDVYVVGGYWNKDKIWLILKEDGYIRTYAWPMNLVFLDELKKAQEVMMAASKGAERWGFKFKGHMKSVDGLDAMPNIVLPQPKEGKALPKDQMIEDGPVHDYGEIQR